MISDTSLYSPFDGDFDPAHEGVIAEFATSLLGPGFTEYREIALSWNGDLVHVCADHFVDDPRHQDDDNRWDYENDLRVPLAWQQVDVKGFFPKDATIYLEPDV